TSLWVVAREFDRDSNAENIQVLQITQVFKNPKFSMFTINNITLLKVATPPTSPRQWPPDAKTPNKLQPVSLPLLSNAEYQS
ncbi:Chymotrypsinogen 2, partial [Galemys pyrenaicus]